MMLEKKNARILEVGCGDQRYAPLLKAKYHGLDLPDSNYILTPPKYIGDFCKVDLNQQRYHCIFGVAVFYLIKDINAAFEKAYNHLEDSGKIILFDYNAHVIEKLQDKFPDLPMHKWNAGKISTLLKNAGFHDIRNMSYLAKDASLILDKPIDLTVTKAFELLIRRVYSNLQKSQWIIITASK